MLNKIYFYPLKWLTIFFTFSFIILICLGTWQIKRLFWKNELIQFYNTQFSKNVILLNNHEIPPKNIEYRKAKIKGKFLNSSEILVTGKTYEGNAGFHVVTPLLTNNGNLYFVNRGWVSEKYKSQDTRKFSIIEGETIISGIIRLPQKKGYFVPKNDIKKNFWITIIPTEMKRKIPINNVNIITNIYIDALRSSNKIKLPIGVKSEIQLRNQHLSYALTWYSLAFALIYVYLAYHHSIGRLTFKKK